MIVTTLKCLLFKMPPTKLLVCHCKKNPSYFSYYQTLSTHKDCFPPSVHIPLQCTVPVRQANSKNERKKAILVTLLSHFQFRYSHGLLGWKQMRLSGF